MLGIIGAMDKEIQDLLQDMTDIQEQQTGFARYYVGTLHGLRLCLARCGIGKVHAAMCAQGMLLTHPEIKAILNIGVAGALRPSLNIGDIVVARSAVQHDMDTTPIGDPLGLISGPNIVHIPCDEELAALLQTAAEEANLRTEHAAVATGDQFIANSEYVQKLRNDYDAYACEMEGAAVAVVCIKYNTPFVVIRALSDKTDGNAHESYEDFGDIAADNSSRIVMKMLDSFGQ